MADQGHVLINDVLIDSLPNRRPVPASRPPAKLPSLVPMAQADVRAKANGPGFPENYACEIRHFLDRDQGGVLSLD